MLALLLSKLRWPILSTPTRSRKFNDCFSASIGISKTCTECYAATGEHDVKDCKAHCLRGWCLHWLFVLRGARTGDPCPMHWFDTGGNFNIDVKVAGATVIACKGDICSAFQCARPHHPSHILTSGCLQKAAPASSFALNSPQAMQWK